MQTQLDLAFDGGGRTNTYSAVYDTVLNKMTLSSNYAEVMFVPLSDKDVVPLAGSFSNSVDLNNLDSINVVLSFDKNLLL